MSKRPFTYLTRWHTTAEFEPRRREWYSRKRALELVGVGFRSVRAYESNTFPNGCNLYEFDDFSVFETEEYRNLRTDDPFVAEIVGDFSYNSKSFYEQLSVVDNTGAILDTVPTLSGDTLSLLYFDATDDDLAIRWFDGQLGTCLSDGMRTARLWRQTREHPRPTGKEARWCAVLEQDRPKMDAGGYTGTDAITVRRADILRKWYGLVLERTQ